MADTSPLIGSIMMFAGNFAPKGFAFCAGQLMAISQNTALFSILGTTYGGDGRVTFALPDLRGRAPLQQGNGAGLTPVTLGEMAGSGNATLLAPNMPFHNHGLKGNSGVSDGASPAPSLVVSSLGDASDPLNAYSSATPNTTLSPASVGLTGNNVPVNVQNPYLGINFIIALVGIFPSRN